MNAKLSDAYVLELLMEKGYRPLKIDVIEEARKCLKKSYRRGASLRLAPDVFDCSGLMSYVFAKKGVRLPRFAIDQLHLGPGHSVARLEDTQAGDLIFTRGIRGLYWDDSKRRAGHVGLVTNDGTIIHAATTKRGVVEDRLEAFFARRRFAGARRPIPVEAMDEIVTLECPIDADIDSSQTIRWVVLSSIRY